MGLFSGPRGHPKGTGIDAEVEAAEEAEAEAAVGASNEDERQARLLGGLACHHTWLAFFTELWDTVCDRTDAEHSAVVQTLLHMLQHSLAHPERLSSHPAAAAPRFRLLLLALRFAGQRAAALADAGSPVPVALVLLHDRVVKAGLTWFLHAPAFSGHLTQRQSEEQHAAVADFVALLEPLCTKPGSWPAWPTGGPAPAYTPGLHGRSTLENALSARHGGSKPPPAAHPVWGTSPVSTPEAAQLLLFLCRREADRLQVWARPVSGPYGAAAAATGGAGALPAGAREWEGLLQCAWRVDPQLAVAITARFPGVSAPREVLTKLLASNAWDPAVQALPGAAMMLATPEAAAAKVPALAALATWAPGQAMEGLELISSPAAKHPAVKAYAVRCLENTPPEQVAFFLPQLVQSLRADKGGQIADALVHMARASDLFAHQLIWALMTEERPPHEAFNPEVKRSGWQPPRDFGLWEPSTKLRERVLAALAPASRAYWEDEAGYFDRVTSISGILKKIDKDERRGAIAVELQKFSPPRSDLYVPTNPDCRVIHHINTSGTPMQSAAKVPILVAFKVQQDPLGRPATTAGHAASTSTTPGTSNGATTAGGLHRVEGGLDASAVGVQVAEHANGSAGNAGAQQQQGQVGSVAPAGPSRTLACIFKVGDDVRQDVLALQVISLLRDAFARCGLPLYLCPYGCLPTGYERGIIEVVPNTKSRAALGELSDRGLHDIFQAEFGAPGSPGFEAARRNFIASEAGYAIASYLLQAKDRHNGNLLITDSGHLVHIDFGFILEISPGGNMGFESAAFKLSHEMTQLLDPGGGRASATWQQFEELCIRGYLAARTVAEPIIAVVALMAESGLPCYGRGQPVANLRNRFRLDLSERAAAQLMRDMINDAYQKWTTGFYDYIQALQNRIPY